MRTPTPTNDTIRWIVPTLDRSTMKSLTTTTAISTAPAIQAARTLFRVATPMLASATRVHRIENAVWTTSERSIASSANGTPPQWWSVRSSTAFAHTNTSAVTRAPACASDTAAIGWSPSRRISTNQSATASRAPTWARSSGLSIGTYGSGAGSPFDTRSEEHTSELQSPYDLVCRLLLEK